MALGFQEQDTITTRNRRVSKTIKFSNHERVEVRSVEEGFKGSWHPGTVIDHFKNGWDLKYVVKYDRILVDDGSDHFIDGVHVSQLVDENDHTTANLCDYRGRIRPLPPPLQFGKWDLHYGMCVDVCYNEGWWEGVVFDHEDGSEERKIFFPDLGDEMMAPIDDIRITQDWSEVTGTWQSRGKWLFLEVIEENEQEHYVPISTKQLWYDLREKDNFNKLGEWISSDKDLWKNLVSEAIGDNLEVAMNHLFQVIGLPEDVQRLLESVKPLNHINTNPEADLAQNHHMPLVQNTLNRNMFYPKSSSVHSVKERSNVHQVECLSLNDRLAMSLLTESNVSCYEKTACVLPQGSSVLPSKQDGIFVANSRSIEEGFSSYNGNKINGSSRCRKSSWLPAGPDLVPGAEFCPDAITKYVNMCGKRPQSSYLRVDVRKHLAYLKWKIEYLRERMIRLRYISPDGKVFYSLREVCLNLTKSHADILSLMSQDKDTNLFNCPANSPSLLIEQPPETQEYGVSSQSDIVAIKPEYCPEAAVDWYKFGYEVRLRSKMKKEDITQMTMRAKKHLSALGWSFRYKIHNGKQELYYISPEGRCYNSLRAACKDSRNERASWGPASTTTHLERKTLSKTVEIQSASKKISPALNKMQLLKLENCSAQTSCISMLRKVAMHQKLKVGGTRKIQKKGKEKSHPAFSLNQQKAISDYYNFLSEMRKGRKTRRLAKLKNNKRGTCPTRVLRSSKRVQQVVIPNPSHQKPRTVLSWLIDNNVVLPREKVHYSTSKGRHPITGRINRDGIKCNCCGEVYALSDFEFHVSGKYCRPAISIFLEDGRSLLDCQMQIMHDDIQNFAAEPPERLKDNCHQGENDHICSVCHYGGELILCDQCPSSFHKSCLGMEDVPDGDWFCPSCCCKICGQNKLKRDTVFSLDDDLVLCCTQCERKYHIGCLRIRNEDSLECFPNEHWFCSKKCEVIFLGLHKLLGKPIPVGSNNLSWTLLKFIQSDSQKHDSSDIEALTEIYSKLSIALDVMHECFEPVEEPHTKRDLLKDVIFSKESELNRLNFRGFYTVLLQKDDEFITVAAVRVYGEKVAEIPLVGTRFQYRRLGMCRILMNVLEKKLKELGVQRLILPAVSSVLNTWTGSFGFSKMTDSERLQFVDYTFLDFQDTVMCHKILRASAESLPSKVHLAEVQSRLHDDASGSGDNINLDGSSVISAVVQADQIEVGIVKQGQVNVAGSNSCSGSEGTGPIHPVNPVDLECEPFAGEINLECSVEDSTFNKENKDNSNSASNTFNMETKYDINGDLKCYRRRRISACGK
ncbi:hypothetical protein P3X46_000719 [Hevea brasiliensis]|uniref:PHD-type domain-containing protein n=1 Tax=Hevea brasiliensis TaxID=3981 RepID=A0ABQ9NAW3_HEVBR|nr:uncharacterized protein LOC131179308 isoform X1 [Hevea brasiliensis]KAJ9189423.1 hypothetical protein P3X46_000719 [Hevea brasiliensis]